VCEWWDVLWSARCVLIISLTHTTHHHTHTHTLPQPAKEGKTCSSYVDLAKEASQRSYKQDSLLRSAAPVKQPRAPQNSNASSGMMSFKRCVCVCVCVM
jgi:hypothetical protein